MKERRLLLILLVIIVLLFLGLFFFLKQKQVSSSPSDITSYESCVKAGNPVLESYPPQCKARDGKVFTQNIGNEMELVDTIVIENPRPNQDVSNPITITGRARGAYFFEGSFPVLLVDENGTQLGKGQAQANGEWMTEDFVPFSAEISYPEGASPRGTLFLEKSNPSGLSENSQRLEVPVILK